MRFCFFARMKKKTPKGEFFQYEKPSFQETEKEDKT